MDIIVKKNIAEIGSVGKRINKQKIRNTEFASSAWMKPLHCKNGTFYEHSVVKNIYIVVKF